VPRRRRTQRGGKKIHQHSVTGQHGVSIIEQAVLKMKHIWSANGPLEAGIDGTIEIRDAVTGELTNCILRVQSKATTKPFLNETEDRFEYPCDERDLEYWLRGNAPVILVCSRVDTGHAYWKSIKDYFRDSANRKSRRVIFDKKADSFDESAGPKLAALAIPKDSGIYLAPRFRQETLYSNLLRVSTLPARLYLAVTEYGSRDEIREALSTYIPHPRREWVTRSKTILSVHDLSQHPWNKVVDPGTVEEFDTSDWAQSDDNDKRNDFAHLLSLCLSEKLGGEPIRWDKAEHVYYFTATVDRKKRVVSYQGVKQRTSKEVFGARWSKRDRSRISYYRHSAFEGRFARYDGEWFLEIVPTYRFTRDGHRPSLFADDLLKTIKRLEHNPAVLGQLFMWAHVLSTESAPLFGERYPFLAFGKIETFPIEVGIEDDEWIKQEPADERAALQAAGQELLKL
jgi:uncharacterized protein DUF4365